MNGLKVDVLFEIYYKKKIGRKGECSKPGSLLSDYKKDHSKTMQDQYLVILILVTGRQLKFSKFLITRIK